MVDGPPGLEAFMSSIEMQLVCKIIKEGKLKEAIEAGLTEDILQTSEMKVVYRQLLSAYESPMTRGSVMGPLTAASMFPMLNVNAVDTHVTVGYLVDYVRKAKVASVVEEHAAKALEMARHDPYQALGFLQNGSAAAMKLDGGRNTDIDFFVAATRFKERYEFIANGGSLGKYPWPWPVLQNETGGVQPDEFMVLYGRPKSKKSFVLSYLIAEAVRTFKERVIVYTKEMSPDDIFMRIVSFMAKIPYHDTRHAKLSPDDRDRLDCVLDNAEEARAQGLLTILSAKDVPPGRDTPSWLGGKADKYQATVMFVDGLYLMSPSHMTKTMKDNDRVAAISREVRQLGLGLKIPILATMQANRAAAKNKDANLDEIAFSDALSQDCTLAVRCIAEKDPTVSLVIGGSREFQLNGFRINAVPSTNFEYHSLLTEADVTKAKAGDVPDEGPAKLKSSIGRARKQAEDAEAKSVIGQI
jgi:hypothetical protein